MSKGESVGIHMLMLGRLFHQRADRRAQQFFDTFAPSIVTFEARLRALQNELENHGTTISAVLDSDTPIGDLITSNIRLRGYRNRFFDPLNTFRDLLIPAHLAPQPA